MPHEHIKLNVSKMKLLICQEALFGLCLDALNSCRTCVLSPLTQPETYSQVQRF